jgi:hypothetical protein
MQIDQNLKPAALAPALDNFWKTSGEKLNLIHRDYDPAAGAPVFTVAGQYTARGWTEWTEGFLYGSDLLQFDATGDASFAQRGTAYTMKRMASHVSHRRARPRFQQPFHLRQLAAPSARGPALS